MEPKLYANPESTRPKKGTTFFFASGNKEKKKAMTLVGRFSKKPFFKKTAMKTIRAGIGGW